MHRSRSPSSVVSVALRTLALPLLAALGACGQKGPLFLDVASGAASAPVAATPLPPLPPAPVRP